MANVLEKIVADTRVRVEALKQSKPLTSFIEQLTPSTRCLYRALSEDNAGFILECKKASPSKGLIRADFDIDAISDTYFNYAAALSVLTDEKYFQGSYEYLKLVTAKATCPILNKDFFVDSYQVYLARFYGADAILLMLSVLTDEEYKTLADIAEQLNLAILTEVSNEEECVRAVKLNAKLIGINNRNLRDLSTDINRTFELVTHIPSDRLIISESGIYTHQQVRTLSPVVNGFLVGSSLMAEDNLDIACRKLVFGEHKVCGITTPSQAQTICKAGAVYAGLIFAEKSPRFITETVAKVITSAEQNLNYVGVFVNHPVETVVHLAQSLKLFAVQLHGQENELYVEELRQQLPNDCRIWQAYGVIDNIPAFNPSVDGQVLDNKNGGSGKTFDWRQLATNSQSYKNTLLAGGIGPSNIHDALKVTTQYQLKGLDLNSGLESAPGIKDSKKIASAFNAIRHY